MAGVLLAFTIPARSRINALEFSREARSLLDTFDRTETGDLVVLTSKGLQETVFALERASGSVTAPILRLEHALHDFSAFVVMPLFAFASAGVKFDLSLQHAEIGFGILAGLMFGKPLGIMIFASIAVKTGIARLPQAVNCRSLLGYACLAGMGLPCRCLLPYWRLRTHLWFTQRSEALSRVRFSRELSAHCRCG